MEGIDKDAEFYQEVEREVERINASIAEKDKQAEIEWRKTVIERYLSLGAITIGSLGLIALEASRQTQENHATQAAVAEYGEHNSAKLDSVKGIYGERVFVYWATKQKDKPENEVSPDSADLSISQDSLSQIESAGGVYTEPALEVRVLRKVPSYWMDNVSSIRQSDSIEEVPDKYGLGKEWTTVAHAKKTKTGLTEIVLTGITKRRSSPENVRTIYHEIAHANDWESSRHLSTEERFDLLMAISQRLTSSDRYMSAYVENIKNKDKQREAYLKAGEYWAEICSVYFSGEGSLSIEDAKLVSKYSDNKYDKKYHVAQR